MHLYPWQRREADAACARYEEQLDKRAEAAMNPYKQTTEGLFKQYMADVKQAMIESAGVGPDDIADFDYVDCFNESVPPDEAAHYALENEGFPFTG